MHEWAIDSIDSQGRISMRPIVVSDAIQRPSNAMTNNDSAFHVITTHNANSAKPKEIPRISQGNGIKFIRKSDLN